MLLCDQIIAAAHAAFVANGDMAALAPGGLWHRRAPSEEEGLTRPYGVVTARESPGAREFISDKSFVQSYLLTVTIYGDESVADTGKITSYLSRWDMDVQMFTALTAQVLGMTPTGEELDLDPEEKSGRDVVLASKQWTLQLHAGTAVIPSN